MRSGTYYLNNYGSRWVHLENGKKTTITLETKSGKSITRTVIYYEAFGNWATALISYKGKKISVFSDTILED
jgi:S-adenosylmethionine hydrolase